MFIYNSPVNPATGKLFAADVACLNGETDFLLFDDFETLGAIDGLKPKLGPDGQRWRERNLATDAPVGGGVAVPDVALVTQSGLSNKTTPGAQTGSWCSITLDEIPGEIGFTFTLADIANVYAPTAAIWPGGTAFSTGLAHFQLSNAKVGNPSAEISVAGVYYEGGNGVQANGWDDRSSGFSLFNLTPGVLYTYRVFIAAPFTYNVITDPTGAVVAKMLAFNTQLSTVLGKAFFIQTFNNRITYRSVWAREKAVASINIRQLLGGLDNTPIGMRTPGPAQFTSVHIGPGQPAGLFSLAYDGLATSTPGVTVGAGGVADAAWKIEGTGNGLGAQLVMTSWLGTGRITFDNNIAWNFFDNENTAWFGKRWHKSPYMMTLPNFTNDTTAAAGGVGVGELYRNGSVVMQRIT